MPNEQDFLGLTEAEARTKAADLGLNVRVSRRDCDCYVGTCDFSIQRVNLSFDNGKVSAAALG